MTAKKRKRKPGFVVFVLVPLLLVILSGFQFGKVKPLYMYYNFSYGARSLSMGNAFTALANDLTAVYRNPAGLAEMEGPQLFVNYRKDKLLYQWQPENETGGLYPREYTYELTSNLRTFDFLSIAVPVYFWDIKGNFALSYYRYIPYGFEARGLGILATARNNETDMEYNRMSIQGSSGIDVLGFTGAFYLSRYLSFGATLQWFFNSGEIIYDWSTPEGAYNQTYTEKIKGWNVVLGLLFKPNKDFMLGLNYHTRVSGTLDTQYQYQDIIQPGETVVSSQAGVIIPSQLSLGAAVKPFRFMLLSFDYSTIYWEKAALSGYFQYEEDLQFPVRDDFSFSQKNIVNYRLGTEFNFPIKKSTLFLRGGWFSDGQLFVDAADKPVKIKGYSLGIGVKISSVFQVDIAYMKQKAAWDEAAYINSQDTVGSDYSNKIFTMSLTFGFGKKQI
jgi:long-chain fatty acid transport protein